MCGIAVHFNSSGWATPLDLELIRHRGPDSRGEWISPGGHNWLGNTRLAIVDLSPTGAQPMMDPATGNVIVTNGEIITTAPSARGLDRMSNGAGRATPRRCSSVMRAGVALSWITSKACSRSQFTTRRERNY